MWCIGSGFSFFSFSTTNSASGLYIHVHVYFNVHVYNFVPATHSVGHIECSDLPWSSVTG